MLKYFLFLIIITSLFSCKKETNSVDVILLENLKETSKHYVEECELITLQIQNRYVDYGYKSDRFESLKLINTHLKNLFMLTDNKIKEEIIVEEEKTCLEINNLSSDYKMKVIDKSKFENLNGANTYYLIKCQLYKIQLKNLKDLIYSSPIYCGSTFYPEEKQELIHKLKTSTVADFKKEFCKCN